MFTRHLSQWYPINFNRLQGHIYKKQEKSFARNTAPPELQAPQLTFPEGERVRDGRRGILGRFSLLCGSSLFGGSAAKQEEL